VWFAEWEIKAGEKCGKLLAASPFAVITSVIGTSDAPISSHEQLITIEEINRYIPTVSILGKFYSPISLHL